MHCHTATHMVSRAYMLSPTLKRQVFMLLSKPDLLLSGRLLYSRFPSCHTEQLALSTESSQSCLFHSKRLHGPQNHPLKVEHQQHLR